MATAHRKLMDSGVALEFPVIAATATTTSSTGSTTHTINLPSSIASGDLLFLVIQWKNASSNVSSFSQSWTALGSNTGSNRGTVMYWRIANGTEGSSTTLTLDASSDFVAAIVYRVTGAESVEISGFATGSSTSPNAPLLEPTWNATKTLWAVFIGAADNRQSLSSYPANFTLSQTTTVGTVSSSSTGQEIWLAAREEEVVNQDPGAGTLSGSIAWVACTIAFKPTGAGAPSAPAIASSATWDTESTGGESTSYSVTLPSNIQSGDLLLMFIGVDGATDVLTHTGWTSLAESTASTEYRYILGRIADGSEGASASFTSSATEAAAAITYRITGARNGLTSSEVSISSVVDQLSNVTSADPPSLTPSWGSAKNLWFAVVYLADGNYGGGVVYPSGYTLGQNAVASSLNAAGGAVFGSARSLTASTEDPGSYSWTTARRSGAYTIAVRPL